MASKKNYRKPSNSNQTKNINENKIEEQVELDIQDSISNQEINEIQLENLENIESNEKNETVEFISEELDFSNNIDTDNEEIKENFNKIKDVEEIENKYLFNGGELTGAEIIARVKSKDIIIDNFDESRVNPNSYNLTLGNQIKTYIPLYRNPNNPKDNKVYLDMKKENPCSEFIIPEKGFCLLPGTLYIATTNERVFTDKFIPQINGRSSIGRLGMFIHVTAGYGDIGFDGKWTLEIMVIQPLIIYPNTEICQVSFKTPYGDTSIQYHGRYQNQKEAQASKFYLG